MESEASDFAGLRRAQSGRDHFREDLMRHPIRDLVVAVISMATLVFSLIIQSPSMAMASSPASITPVTIGTMSNKINAKAKEAEGKLEAAYGDLIGDTVHKIQGQAKQVQASAMNAAETVKDGAKSVARGASDAADDLAAKIK